MPTCLAHVLLFGMDKLIVWSHTFAVMLRSLEIHIFGLSNHFCSRFEIKCLCLVVKLLPNWMLEVSIFLMVEQPPSRQVRCRGFFAIYAGFMYNDFFSVGLQLFDSRWKVFDSFSEKGMGESGHQSPA